MSESGISYDGKRLLQDVKLILCDEPYIGAVQVSGRLLKAVLQFSSEKGLSVVCDDGQMTFMGMTTITDPPPKDNQQKP